MEIWIIRHCWPAAKSGNGYEWELFSHDKPICKSSPVHGETYFFTKRSAIKAAVQMRSVLFPGVINPKLLKLLCLIIDVTHRGEKNAKERTY